MNEPFQSEPHKRNPAALTIIPAYNEGRSLPNLLKELKSQYP
jgi:hypothetical protein